MSFPPCYKSLNNFVLPKTPEEWNEQIRNLPTVEFLLNTDVNNPTVSDQKQRMDPFLIRLAKEEKLIGVKVVHVPVTSVPKVRQFIKVHKDGSERLEYLAEWLMHDNPKSIDDLLKIFDDRGFRLNSLIYI